MTALEWIVKARKVVDQDAHLANYMVRDLPETKEAGLDDLAWAIHRHIGGRNDVAYLLDELEAFVKEKMAEETDMSLLLSESDTYEDWR